MRLVQRARRTRASAANEAAEPRTTPFGEKVWRTIAEVLLRDEPLSLREAFSSSSSGQP